MELIRCWGCGHLGPEGDPDGLCPVCADQGEPAEVVDGECVEPYQVPETGEAAMFVGGEAGRECYDCDHFKVDCQHEIADAPICAEFEPAPMDLGPLFGGLS